MRTAQNQALGRGHWVARGDGVRRATRPCDWALAMGHLAMVSGATLVLVAEGDVVCDDREGQVGYVGEPNKKVQFVI